MKLSMSSCQGITKVFRIATIVSLLTLLFSFYEASPQPQKKPPAQKQSSTEGKAGSMTPPETGQISPEEAKRRREWHKFMLQKSVPKKGCFTAAYPETTWREVPCKPSTPHKLFLPRRGGISRLDIVGGAGPDFSATVTGNISLSEGSFDSVTGVTSTNAYSLQLNTAPFSTSTCSGSPNSGCNGWEQFVYESSGSGFIQYWLLEYGPAGTLCPMPRHTNCHAGLSYADGWCAVQLPLFPGDPNPTQCVVNAVNEAPAPAEPMTSLGQLRVAGAAAGAGGAANDSITVTVGGTPYTAVGNNYFPDLSTQWKEAEFNVFGNGGGSQATFNSGANLQVRTEVISGTNLGPGCDLRSWTGESNNLTLVNSPPSMPAALPAPVLVFAQSNPASPGAAATCADAVSIGDTHLHTFNGLFYDFQAAGDFVLAGVAPGFEVQTRQVSGAPTWPNATVNKGVAARFGETKVAVCLPPPGSNQLADVHVNGKLTAVPDGKTLELPGGVGIARQNNVYQLTSEDGDSVRAEINPGYINVNVGLGRWPSSVHGLIANPTGNANQIQTRDGVMLTNPFSFDDLYHRFADSWRVSERESMLSACNTEKPIEVGIPRQSFYAKDLEPEIRQKSQGVCTAAGVKPGPLFEACTLDVAVIGQDAAAQVFVGAIPPATVGTIAGGAGAGFLENNWWWLLLLLLAIIMIVWFLLRKKP